MNIFKKPLAFLLTALLCTAMAGIGITTVSADSYFDDGDYRFAVKSDNTLAVAHYYGNETELVLPERVGDRLVTGVHSRCFQNAEIVSVSLPRNYTDIGVSAFSGCTALTTVKLSLGLLSIGMMAFMGCTSLSSVDFEMPNNLTTIATAAFYGCTALETAELPDTLTNLGESAFYGCSVLHRVHISTGLTAVPANAFNRNAFERLQLHDGLLTIGAGAFANNDSLTFVDFPLSLKKISAGAFANDNALEGVFVPDSVTSIGTDAFTPMIESDMFAVQCFENSAAAEYFSEAQAADLNIYIKLYGDLNLDGAIDITDVTCVQKYLAELEEIRYSALLEIADANLDGEVDISDATYIQCVIAGLIT